MYICRYIYIEIEIYSHLSLSLSLYIYIYIYVFSDPPLSRILPFGGEGERTARAAASEMQSFTQADVLPCHVYRHIYIYIYRERDIHTCIYMQIVYAILYHSICNMYALVYASVMQYYMLYCIAMQRNMSQRLVLCCVVLHCVLLCCV